MCWCGLQVATSMDTLQQTLLVKDAGRLATQSSATSGASVTATSPWMGVAGSMVLHS